MPSTPAETTTRRSPRLRGLVALLAALLALFALYWSQYQKERSAIAELPTTERRALYDRIVRTLQTTCSNASDGLRAYCVEQSELIVLFPECDEACRILAHKHMRQATR